MSSHHSQLVAVVYISDLLRERRADVVKGTSSESDTIVNHHAKDPSFSGDMVDAGWRLAADKSWSTLSEAPHTPVCARSARREVPRKPFKVMLRTQATSKQHGSICPSLKEHAHRSPSPKMAKDTKYARVLKTTTLPPTKARKVVMLTPLRSVLQNISSDVSENYGLTVLAFHTFT